METSKGTSADLFYTPLIMKSLIPPNFPPPFPLPPEFRRI